MGQIADDLIDGSCCELCGQFFEDEKDHHNIYSHGYPVVCKECWKGLSEEDKKKHQRALVNTI